MTNQHILPCFG